MPSPSADNSRSGGNTPPNRWAIAASSVAVDEIERLARGEHHDPHSILGIHDGVVRVLRPNAEKVAVVVHGQPATAATRVHDAGIFEARTPLKGDDGDSSYEVEATYPDGSVHRAADPYRFWPTVGELDLHLAGEGRHHDLWRRLGAHPQTMDGVTGTAFAVWAPSARALRVVGDFNHWDGRAHPMRALGGSGVWELFVPGVAPAARYKFEILTGDGHLRLKADPMAFAAEEPPGTASVVAAQPAHAWTDDAWLARRAVTDWRHAPMSIYEIHLGSWRRVPDEDNRPLTYLELAEQLPAYVTDLGFTHVELLPIAEHPFGGSWGYQVSSYFAPTARHGTPDEFRALVDALHAAGVGVIVDWVPAHFPRDDWALARFDGTALYEHADPRQGSHPDWGTLVFNYGRHEVRNFLIANVLYWLEEFHIDGMRVDAVASMLYLDYSRQPGEWVPNPVGGRENLDAVSFLRELNEVVHARHPGVAMVAEESTAWPAVSRPTYDGGLGFGFKWNMGWMHDTLRYFEREPIHRTHHQDDLTFGLLYAFTENFVLPLSHDEVVHGKGSLLAKMPGDRWQKAANLRALLAWMFAHPGKKLLFMGAELAQTAEWNHDGSLEWHLLQYPEHRGVHDLVRSLHRVYAAEPALWEGDPEPEGFSWIAADDRDANVLAFLRWPADRSRHRPVACVANLSPVPRPAYRVGLPEPGPWIELVNTDATEFAGSGVGNLGVVTAEDRPDHGMPASAVLTLPPLAVLWLAPAR